MIDRERYLKQDKSVQKAKDVNLELDALGNKAAYSI